MSASGFNLGIDPQELVLLLTSFSAQHDFFEIIANPSSGLGLIALTFGLIGFVSLLLLPANWDGKVILPWFFLMIVLFARPMSDPLFFSDPLSATSDILNQPLCSGGVIDQEECQEIVGGSGGGALTLSDVVASEEGRGSKLGSSFKMFTPIAVTLHVINTLHEGIVTELEGFGARSIDKHIVAIETVRRSVTANNFATYAVANFQASCGAKNQNFARYAGTSHAMLLKKNPEIVKAMRQTPLTVLDGVLMFNNFNSFKDRGENFGPPLVCAEGAQTPCGGGSPYDLMPMHKRSVKDLNKLFGPRSILYKSPADFERLLKKDTSSTAPSGVEEAIVNLKNEAYKGIEKPFEAFREQPVSILLPTNAKAILEGRYKDITDFDDEIDSLAEEIDNASQNFIINFVGAVAGVGVGVSAAVIGIAICTALTGGVCGILASILVAGVTVFSSLGTYNIVRDKGTEARIASLEQRVVDLADRGVVSALNNCGELHRFTDMQLAIAGINFSYARKELSEFLADNRDLLKEHEGDLMGLPARERMDILLASVAERNKHDCIKQGDRPRRDGMLVVRGGQTVEQCQAIKNREISQLQAILRTENTRQSSAAAAAFLDNASDAEFGGGGFRLASNLGEIAGPFGIWFKTILGGFGAGTYSSIMPVLVSYASAIIIIMTPLLFMIGLMVPTWSVGVILLPIVVVAYFQLTKVIFSMIGIISGVFIAAKNEGLIQGLTSSFSDLVIATAYTASFLLTGVIMFALKDPFGAVKQVAGGADKTSTISGQEALQLVGAGYAATLIPKKIADGIENIQPTMGKAAAISEVSGGPNLKRFLSESGNIERGKFLSARADKTAQAQYHERQSAEDYESRAAGRQLKLQVSEMFEKYKGNGNNASIKATREGLKDVNGTIVRVAGLDNAIDSLDKAISKAGMSFGLSGMDKLGDTPREVGKVSRFDEAAHDHDGTVANIFSVKALKDYGGVDVEELVKSGHATYMDDTKKEIRVVEHHGHLSDSATQKTEPGDKGGGTTS